MFAYIEKDSFLHRRNPLIKLILIVAVTIIVCLSYFPVLPFFTFLIFFAGTWIGGKIPFPNLLRRLLLFLVVSFLFMVSMVALRGLNEEPGIILRLWIFRWTQRDLVHGISLGFRILALVTMSMGFVLTTRPSDLVLSLITQCKLSITHGYATWPPTGSCRSCSLRWIPFIWLRRSGGFPGIRVCGPGLPPPSGSCCRCSAWRQGGASG